MKVIYFLPVKGLSGGANSVIQEIVGLNRLGVDASLLVNEDNHNAILYSYSELPQLRSLSMSFASDADIVKAMQSCDCFVMTLASWVPHLVELCRSIDEEQRPKLYYYIQDYEALFYDKGSDDWKAALESYNYADSVISFAKTAWLCETVEAHHGCIVHKVAPSVDTDLFFPNMYLRGKRKKRKVVAMVRPKTPRRAPRRTIRILAWLKENFDVDIEIFGTNPDDLEDAGYRLHKDIVNHGVLKRRDVAELLRSTDLVIDLSDYQAFGRTAIEAMACGALAVLPKAGGAREFIRDDINSFMVDTWSETAIRHKLTGILELDDTEFAAMQWKALETASEYSVHKACASIGALFACREA